MMVAEIVKIIPDLVCMYVCRCVGVGCTCRLGSKSLARAVTFFKFLQYQNGMKGLYVRTHTDRSDFKS